MNITLTQTAQCASSPSGKHCYHLASSFGYYTCPQQMTCCHCGQPESAEHGPYYPGRSTPTVTFGAVPGGYEVIS